MDTKWGLVVNPTPRPLYPRERDPVPIVWEAGEPQGQCGQVRKISPLSGFDPRTVQPVASRYTDYALPAHIYWMYIDKPCSWLLTMKSVHSIQCRHSNILLPGFEIFCGLREENVQQNTRTSGLWLWLWLCRLNWVSVTLIPSEIWFWVIHKLCIGSVDFKYTIIL